MANAIVDKTEIKNGSIFYDSYVKRKEDPKEEPEIGVELMMGPLILNSDNDKKRALEIAKNNGCNMEVKDYDLNTGKLGEPEKTINVFAVKLKNDNKSIDTNKKLLKNLRKAFNDFNKRENINNKNIT